MNAELKPCPFCGEKAELIHHTILVVGMTSDFARCTECKAIGPCFHNELDGASKAIAAWNRRPLMDQPTLYDVLVAGAKKLDLNMNDDDPCMVCKYSPSTCQPTDCRISVIDTLQDIALEAGFDLKKITAEAKEGQ